MNVYDEMTAKKGQNDVTSIVPKHFNTYGATTETLVLFSDGCSGQNKNKVWRYDMVLLWSGSFFQVI